MILEIRNINKSFGNRQVLKDISFSATTKKPLGFLGRNGHGKSTTIRIIMGIIFSDSGEVLIDGKKLSNSNIKLGYLPEERGLYQKVEILEQMIYFGRLRGMKTSDAKKSALKLLDRLEAGEYAKQKASTLSKGNQQKIQLAVALINNPDIIILDEPFSGLDPVNAQLLKELIEENAKLSKIVLFSSHQLGNVEEFCEDVCIINKGEVILSGNLQNIKDTYPKDRLLIVPEKNKQEIFKNILDNDQTINSSISKYELQKNGFVVTLKDESYKNTILNTLINSEMQAGIDSFSTLEPTLLEIFLEKVKEIENDKQN